MVESIDNSLNNLMVGEYLRFSRSLGIGNTHLVKIELSKNPRVRIYAKDESENFTGSVKSRPALFNIIRSFYTGNDERTSEKHFLDASSGNYAKALAAIASFLGHRSTIFVPEKVDSHIRLFMGLHDDIVNFLKRHTDFGIDTSFTKPPFMSSIDGNTKIDYEERILIDERGRIVYKKIKDLDDKRERITYRKINNSDDAREAAERYAKVHPEMEFLDQYNNPGSWLCHYHSTAEEIAAQMNNLSIIPTHFISGIGSGGTLIGIGKKLKEAYKGLQVIGIETIKPHSITGIRRLDTNIPGVYSDSKDIVDRLLSVDQEQVIKFRDANELNYGFLNPSETKYGVSACANIYAAVKLSEEIKEGMIVTIIPDRGKL